MYKGVRQGEGQKHSKFSTYQPLRVYNENKPFTFHFILGHMIITMPKATSYLKPFLANNTERKLLKRDEKSSVWLETSSKQDEMDFSQITAKSKNLIDDDDIPDLEPCD